MKQDVKIRSAKQLAIYGVCSAIVCVATIFIRIPGLSPTGYVNLGDAFIFLFGILFGPTAGLVCGGLGSAIADLVGFPLYAPITLVVKGLEGLIVGLLAHKLFLKTENKHMKFGFSVAAMAVAALEMIVLYGFVAIFMSGDGGVNFAAGIGEVLAGLVQGGVSMGIASALLFATNLSNGILNRTFIPDPILTGRKKEKQEKDDENQI